MQININDNLYQQLSDYAIQAHMKTERILEEALTKYFSNIPSKRKKWPKGLFDPYPTDDVFPDMVELRQGLIEPKMVDL